MLLCFCIYSKTTAQQTNQMAESCIKDNVILGVITENPEDFYKVTDLLKNKEGITVYDYCFDQKLVSISFSKEYFAELTEVFAFIESYIDKVQCYRMKMDKASYNRICKNEVAKQSPK